MNRGKRLHPNNKIKMKNFGFCTISFLYFTIWQIKYLNELLRGVITSLLLLDPYPTLGTLLKRQFEHLLISFVDDAKTLVENLPTFGTVRRRTERTHFLLLFGVEHSLAVGHWAGLELRVSEEVVELLFLLDRLQNLLTQIQSDLLAATEKLFAICLRTFYLCKFVSFGTDVGDTALLTELVLAFGNGNEPLFDLAANLTLHPYSLYKNPDITSSYT